MQKVLGPMEHEVQIAQKIVKYTTQKDVEPGIADDTQQKSGIKLHNATRWAKTKRCLS